MFEFSTPRLVAKRARKTVALLLIEAAVTLLQLTMFWTETVAWETRYAYLESKFSPDSCSPCKGEELQELREYCRLSEEAESRVVGIANSLAVVVWGRITVTTVCVSHVAAVILAVWLLGRNGLSTSRLSCSVVASQLLDLTIDATSWISLVDDISNPVTALAWWSYPTLILTVVSLFSSVSMIKTSPFSKWKLKPCYGYCSFARTRILVYCSSGGLIAALTITSVQYVGVVTYQYLPCRKDGNMESNWTILAVSLVTVAVLASSLAAVKLNRLYKRCEKSRLSQCLSSISCVLFETFWGSTQLLVCARYSSRAQECSSVSVFTGFADFTEVAGILGSCAIFMLSVIPPWAEAKPASNCSNANTYSSSRQAKERSANGQVDRSVNSPTERLEIA